MTRQSQKPTRDLHAEVTAKIIAAIASDPGRPQMPWRRSGTPLWLPENALTKKGYNGINVVCLWAAAHTRGFSAPIWASYRQRQRVTRCYRLRQIDQETSVLWPFLAKIHLLVAQW